MSDAFFSTDLLGEFDRLQRQMASLFPAFPASLRATRSETFPLLNIGSTDDSVEIVALAPGLDPAAIDLSTDKGVLTISGERRPPERQAEETIRACMPANASWARSGASSSCRSTRIPTRSVRAT